MLFTVRVCCTLILSHWQIRAVVFGMAKLKAGRKAKPSVASPQTATEVEDMETVTAVSTSDAPEQAELLSTTAETSSTPASLLTKALLLVALAAAIGPFAETLNLLFLSKSTITPVHTARSWESAAVRELRQVSPRI